MEDGEFKICPFCKERIRARAVKCRYCGEWLEGTFQRESTGQYRIAQDKTAKTATVFDVKALLTKLHLNTLFVISVALLLFSCGVMLFALNNQKLTTEAAYKQGEAIARIIIGAGLLAWAGWGSFKKRKDYAFLIFSVVCVGASLFFAYSSRMGMPRVLFGVPAGATIYWCSVSCLAVCGKLASGQ